MGHDVWRIGRERQLQNHIIVRIGKKRPPMKVYLLKPGLVGQISDETEGVIGGQSRRQMLGSREGILPLGIKAY
jgi:hypothetical protein